jgi:site-specific DNA-methyltransferase (adenine-specific)
MVELHWKDKARPMRQSHAVDAPNKLVTCEEHNSQDSDSLPTSADKAVSWRNRLIQGDAIEALIALLPELSGQVDLVYIDPPFMTGRDFKSGSQLAYSDKWSDHLDTYLLWLYQMFDALHRLLAEEGSLYVHLDWRAVHYAKVLLDEVFGFSPNADGPGFKNEIIWHYQSGGRAYQHYARKHDTVLFYTKSGRYCFHPERISERRGTQKRNHMRKRIDSDGQVQWTISSAGRTYSYSEDSLMTPSDVWHDISHLHQRHPERSGYATQKPAALLERIILASSEEHSLVLDCCCGSGVTPVAAQQLGRRWIACDRSELAINITRQRLLDMEPEGQFVMQRITTSSEG